MMYSKSFLGLIPLCFSLTVQAGTMGSVAPRDYFVALSGGLSWTNSGSSQVILLEPDLLNNYIPNNINNSNLLGNGEFFAGIQRSFFPQVQSQFGVAFYLSSFAKLNGYIQQDGDSGFQNYTFQYKVQHSHLALKTKWIAENAYNMNPYLSGSIGVGFNRSYGFAASPIVLQAPPMPPFQDKNRTAFTYTLGAGFQHTVSEHLSFGLGYQFVSWGANSLARTEGQSLSNGLHLNSIYTHGVEFNISYLI